MAALIWGKATVNKKDICRDGGISLSSKYTPTDQFSAQNKDGQGGQAGRSPVIPGDLSGR